MEQDKVGGWIFLRYSEPFKLHVVLEIESGSLTIEGARLRTLIAAIDSFQR